MDRNNKRPTCACGCGSVTNSDRRGHARRYLRGHARRGAGSGWVERGYRYVSIGGKKTAVHRLTAARTLGRGLTSADIVHHIDEDPLNNDPQNLIVITRAEHMRLHARPQRRRWSASEILRARELRQAGMKAGDIARLLARPISSTERHLAPRSQDPPPSD